MKTRFSTFKTAQLSFKPENPQSWERSKNENNNNNTTNVRCKKYNGIGASFPTDQAMNVNREQWIRREFSIRQSLEN